MGPADSDPRRPPSSSASLAPTGRRITLRHARRSTGHGLRPPGPASVVCHATDRAPRLRQGPREALACPPRQHLSSARRRVTLRRGPRSAPALARSSRPSRRPAPRHVLRPTADEIDEDVLTEMLRGRIERPTAVEPGHVADELGQRARPLQQGRAARDALLFVQRCTSRRASWIVRRRRAVELDLAVLQVGGRLAVWRCEHPRFHFGETLYRTMSVTFVVRVRLPLVPVIVRR